MKPTLFLLFLAIGVSAQVGPRSTYFGDRSRGEFYPVACNIASEIPSENWIVFDSREDAERRGYQFTSCPVDRQTAKIKRVRATRPNQANPAQPLTMVMITSEPAKWVGRSVTVHAGLKVTDVWKYDDRSYAFRISDGSNGFYVYMEKNAAASLHDLILKRHAAEALSGDFTLYLDPKGYQNGSELYG